MQMSRYEQTFAYKLYLIYLETAGLEKTETVYTLPLETKHLSKALKVFMVTVFWYK